LGIILHWQAAYFVVIKLHVQVLIVIRQKLFMSVWQHGRIVTVLLYGNTICPLRYVK